MKYLDQLISALRSKGIQVRADGEELAIRAPKGSMTAELANELRSNKAQLLIYLRQAQDQKQVSLTVPVANPSERDQLSDGQRRLWFLNQLEGSSSTYNMPLAVRAHGPISDVKVQQTLTQIVQRHETLRTRFVNDGDLVKAIIDTESALQLVVEEANDQLPIPKQIEMAVSQAAQAVFDLANEQLLKAWLVKLSDDTHLLLLTLHHIIADGWSLANLIDEFTLLYSGASTRLPTLEVQYIDYVVWQSQQKDQATQDTALQWWREQLTGAPDLIALPLDHPRRPLMSYRGKCIKSRLSQALISSVERTAKQHELTSYMLMLSAFAAVLQRYAGTKEPADLVIGTTAANRPHPELEPLIGLFINMLALRVQVDGNQTGSALFQQVKNVSLQANLHQDVAFEKIVEALNPRRSLAYAPIFQVTFDVQNAPQSELRMDDVLLEPIEPAVTSSKFDLSLSIESDGIGSFARWTWNPDIFADSTIDRLDQQFQILLANIAAHPDMKVGQLPIIDDQESKALAAAQLLNNRPIPQQSWLSAFEENVRIHASEPALTFGMQSLTYQELHKRAIDLAKILKSRGVSVEDKVAVILERSLDLVVSLLAVQYAGAAYIPLDPAYPNERLTWVFEDAKPSAVLTQKSLSSKLPAGLSAAVILVDDEKLDDPFVSVEYEIDLPAPETLAYIIFTSGSTGRPKGVQIEHRALANFLHSMAAKPGLDSQDVLLSVTTISFDIAALELYLPLTVGAHLIVCDRDTASNGQALQATLLDKHVTCMQATPSTWRLLLDNGWDEARGLKVLCGGEALPRDLANRMQSIGAIVWNVYGPTETTIWSAVRLIAEHNDEQAIGNEPIGTGIANTQLYVLDEFGNLLPPGIPGELWIGGVGLARGYLNRPGQTAERYRPDPYGTYQGSRLYGTGDLVRAKTDGTYEFLGRIDGQVKLRGYRIELGEIESALRRQAGISEAVVMVVGEDPVDRQLVAYLEPNAGTAPTADGLRTALRSQLPAYMVPGQFIVLPRLPLTPNGKIDRKALPKPTIELDAPAAVSISPRNTIEQRIAEIWCHALKRRSIDIDTNFFDAGGHSLLLTQVHHRLELELGQRIDLVTLFQHTTIRSLANHLDSLQSNSSNRFAVKKLTNNQRIHGDIAIIGMACRLPGAPDLESFWNALLSGESGIRFFTKEELKAAGISSSDYDSPNYVPAHGAIDDIDCFDAAFFGYRPAQARLIDPQQRLFLQTAWHTLEHAGYANTEANPSIGVFAGCGQNDYLIDNVLPHLTQGDGLSTYEAILGAEKDFIATRVSYDLDLKGPSVNVQTACSTSLVAVHMACQSLRAGECEMALAGGVALRVPQANGHHFQEGMITSPDGHCRPFEARAQGTVWGSGSAAVLLKPLEQALADGDTIHAVIKGSATNNDGAQKVGFTAPSLDGQASVIRQAQALAGVKPQDIKFVETHGTATALGDLVEVSALKQVWADTERSSCMLGAVKSQIGHLNSAAGIAGLIKAALSVQRGHIPANPYFETANTTLEIEQSPFCINQQSINWPSGLNNRLAGVSSFGIGGTNAHVIVSNAKPVVPAARSDDPQWLMISAHSQESLAKLAEQFSHSLSEHSEHLGDVAATLALGRKPMAHRAAVVASDAREAEELFKRAPLHQRQERPMVVWLFSGQGSQSRTMGQSLYRRWPIFRNAIDECATIAQPLLGFDLRDIFDPARAQQSTLAEHLDETWLTQPALFAFEYAQARLWQSWLVEPNAMLGHSLGEYVAACIAGVFDLATSLKLVIARGQLIWQQEAGAMLAVGLDSDKVMSYLSQPIGEQLDLAAVNGPKACVVAGPKQAIDALESLLKTQNHPCKLLNTSHAFHSRMLDAVKGEFARIVEGVKRSAPQLPLISNVTGTWLTKEQALDPTYWAQHIGATVQFSSGINAAVTDPSTVLLEIGPGQVLTQLARQQTARGAVALASGDSDKSMLQAAANLWCEQVSIDPARCVLADKDNIRRVPLPLYPFAQQRHWLEPLIARREQHLGRLAMEDWFVIPHWRPTIRPAQETQLPHTDWYLDGLKDSWIGGLQTCLDTHHHRFEHLTIGSDSDIVSVVERMPLHETPHLVICSNGHTSTFERILAWAQGWHTLRTGQALNLIVLTPPIHPVLGMESLNVADASLRAAILVVAQEFPAIRIRCIDVDPQPDERVIKAVWQELCEPSDSALVGIRGIRRYVPDYVAVQIPPNKMLQGLRKGGVYLITGGLGRMGLAIARGLIEQLDAKVILTSRHLPSTSDEVHSELIQLGPNATAKAVDVTDQAAMANLIKSIDATHRQLHGVFHAAGSPGHWCSVLDSAPDTGQDLLRTKLAGAEVLAQVLQNHPVDFCVLMSSVASELGGLGYAHYAAANASLDAFAHQMSTCSHVPWLSICWDAWRFDTTGNPEWISTQEGTDALFRVIGAMPCPRIIVSTTDWHTRIDRWIKDLAKTQTEANLEQPIALEVAGLSPTQSIVASIWQATLGYESIGLDDDYFELGGDSMLAIRIVEMLQGRFKRSIPMTAILQYSTVRKMAHLIDGHDHVAGSLLVQLNAVESRESVFIVPGTGGSVIYLADLARELGKLGYRCAGLQASGLNGESPPLDSIEGIARENVAALLSHQPEGPYTLLGHSLGSWICFEMAKQLKAQGHDVRRVIVLDTAAPGPRANDQMRNWSDRQWLASVAQNVGQVWDQTFDFADADLDTKTWDQQIEWLHGELVSAGILPAHSKVELVRGLVEVFRTQSLIQYHPIKQRNCPITLLRAREPLAGFLEGIPDDIRDDQTWGWCHFGLGTVAVEFVEGNHLNMVSGQLAINLAACIRSHLSTNLEVLS